MDKMDNDGRSGLSAVKLTIVGETFTTMFWNQCVHVVHSVHVVHTSGKKTPMEKLTPLDCYPIIFLL